MKMKWFKRLSALTGILLLLSPCFMCWWVFIGSNLVFRWSLPVFPDAREIFNTDHRQGGGSEQQIVYFWTSKPIEEVRDYYIDFTAPFGKRPYEFHYENSVDYWRTVFNPSGQAIPVITMEFSPGTHNATESLACYYEQFYNCVEIELVDFGKSNTVIIPDLPTGHPSPVQPDLQGGTLIVFTYYTIDW